MKKRIRLGRISYLNVLPVYYYLEQNLKNKTCLELVRGTPAELNQLMSLSELDISSTSSIEFARNYQHYHLIPNLCIGSRGSVQSVLLLSKYPIPELQYKKILVSAQTHTSAALLKLLLKRRYGLEVFYGTGDIRSKIQSAKKPEAFLAIGDEALQLRNHQDYPYTLDLGKAWKEWTGLPFIFGVWVVNKQSVQDQGLKLRHICKELLASKEKGKKQLEFFAELVATQGILSKAELESYFHGLVFDMQSWEIQGLLTFFASLVQEKKLPKLPDLSFFPNNYDLLCIQ